MRDWAKVGIVLSVIAALAGTILVFCVLNYGVSNRIEQQVEEPRWEPMANASWESVDGIMVTVTIPKIPSQSYSEHARKSREFADAFRREFKQKE